MRNAKLRIKKGLLSDYWVVLVILVVVLVIALYFIIKGSNQGFSMAEGLKEMFPFS